MPSAPDDLRAKFPGCIEQAFEVIDDYCVVERSGLIRPKKGVDPKTFPQRVNDAIDYLWLEWDYGYEPTSNPNKHLLPIEECILCGPRRLKGYRTAYGLRMHMERVHGR